MLAAGTSIEELTEGLSIGEPVLANTSRDRHSRRHCILGWTTIIATLVGGFALRDIAPNMRALLIAAGVGGMF